MKNIEGVNLKLSPEKSEEFFYNALCNSLGYMEGYGLEFDCDIKEYNKAKKVWKDKNPNGDPCYEDILMEMLREGYKLTFNDIEGEGDMTRSITLNDVHTKVEKVPFRFLSDMIEETDDAETGDVILQTVFFDEIVFG